MRGHWYILWTSTGAALGLIKEQRRCTVCEQTSDEALCKTARAIPVCLPCELQKHGVNMGLVYNLFERTQIMYHSRIDWQMYLHSYSANDIHRDEGCIAFLDRGPVKKQHIYAKIAEQIQMDQWTIIRREDYSFFNSHINADVCSHQCVPSGRISITGGKYTCVNRK